LLDGRLPTSQLAVLHAATDPKHRTMNQDTCNICNGTLEDGYCRDPIFFGKHSGPTCFACFTVPTQLPGWQRGDPKPLHSVDDMMSFGWTKPEAKFHIRAVKRHFRIRTPRTPSSDSGGLKPQVAQETSSPSERASGPPSALQGMPAIDPNLVGA
jgi:hypothetical protein